MLDVKFSVLRNEPESGDREVIERFHEDRKQVIQDVLASQELEAKDIRDTHINPDTKEEVPNELAEIIIALGSAGAFTALAAGFKSWLDRKKIAEVNVKLPQGEVTLSGATAEDFARVAQEPGLTH